MDFEHKLMEKYPSLFYQKEDGTLYCHCGAWVPEGWEKTVDELCGAIVSYTKCTFRSKQEITSKQYYLWNAIAKLLDWSHKRFLKLCPKYNKWEYNKVFYSFVEKFRQRSYKCVKYNKVYPPEVKIDQIKEKYGELCFYFSGGDNEVEGMVYFAERLCSKTCEVSGEGGELCRRGGWFKTLSKKVCETSPYEGYKPIKNNE